MPDEQTIDSYLSETPETSDYWTWLRFKQEVFNLTPADSPDVRLGVGEFYLKTLRQSVLNLQRFIPAFRKRHESLYYPGDFVSDGHASVGAMPPGCQLNGAWFFSLDKHRRYPVVSFPWERRFEMVHRHIGNWLESPYITLTSASLAAVEIANRLLTGQPQRHVGLMAVDPQQHAFYLYPEMAGQWVLSLHWTGTKLDFKDDELVPFDEEAASAVADYVTAKIRLRLDRDPLQHDKFWADYVVKRTNLYVDNKSRGELK